MKASELRKMSEDDLKQKYSDMVQEHFNLKFQLNTGRLENTGKLYTIRKDIARINTILTESRG